MEQRVELLPKGSVIRSDRGENAGMIEGCIERLLQVAHPGNDAGFEQRIQIAEALSFFLQLIEAAQDLDVLIGQRRRISVGENLQQRDFERRKGKRTIKSKTAALPLAGHPRMTIQKSRNQVSLVAMNIASIFVASKIPKHRLGNFRVGVGRKGPSQHGWSDCQVEQAKPAVHRRQSFLHAAVAL